MKLRPRDKSKNLAGEFYYNPKPINKIKKTKNE